MPDEEARGEQGRLTVKNEEQRFTAAGIEWSDSTIIVLALIGIIFWPLMGVAAVAALLSLGHRVRRLAEAVEQAVRSE